MSGGLLEEFWQQRFVCLSASPRCETHKYPSGSLANDLATPALHSINISLKSIMSLLNEIKAKRFKSCFSLVSANMSITPDAVYFSTLLLPPRSLSLPLSLLLIAQRERFIKSPKLRLISTVLWIVKMPRLTWRLQSRPPTHPPLLTNQLINIAMETKWQEIAFHQTGAGVIISWRWLAACSFINALCREQCLVQENHN